MSNLGKIEEELDELRNEISKKEEKVSAEISSLQKQSKFFTYIAWGLVILGTVLGFIYFFFTKEDPIKWNEIGDFIGGVTASFWSLAGLLFVFIAFLGQKQQLAQQRLEISFNQYELKATRFELEGQKGQMEEQNKNL
ncbi:MAG: hypothetical protein AAGI38_18330, partial [Bacteroidota bacterium]